MNSGVVERMIGMMLHTLGWFSVESAQIKLRNIFNINKMDAACIVKLSELTNQYISSFLTLNNVSKHVEHICMFLSYLVNLQGSETVFK